jgi:hypothetical protein
LFTKNVGKSCACHTGRRKTERGERKIVTIAEYADRKADNGANSDDNEKSVDFYTFIL